MKVRYFFATLFISSCHVVPVPPQTDSEWQLTFFDEFDGTGKPDSTKWQSENYNRRENANGPDGWWDDNYVRLDGEGNLILSVARIPNRNNDDDPYDFATGMVSTKGLFEQRYGRFEARARLPRETGWWAAFWLFSASTHDEDVPGRDGLEIDIMEGFGKSDRAIHALHWDGFGEAHETRDKKLDVAGIRDGFHTYALEWSPTEYIFFVDGVETWRTSLGDVGQVPVYIKVTGEISTLDWIVSEDWAGALSPAAYPDEYVIDYVRVWSK